MVRLAAAWLGAMLLLASWMPALAQSATPLSTRPQYSLQATIDYDAAAVQTTEDVHFHNGYGAPLPSVVFHSMAGFYGALQLTEASVDGQSVSPTFDATGSVIELPLAAPIPTDADADVHLVWLLTVPRTPNRLSASNDTLSLGNWFPTLAVHHGDWDRRPFQEIGDAFYTESADYAVSLDLSRAATVAFTGDVVEHHDTHWQLTADDVRDFALAISPGYAELDSTVDGGPNVSVYTLGANQAEAEAFLDAARDFADAYKQLVGPYPYSTLRVAETGLPPQWAGMEYPELVFISTGVKPHGAASIRAVVAHEVAHQWFYGLIGDDELSDPWLDEAFATYLPLEASETMPVDHAADSALAPPGPGPAVDQSIEDFPSEGAYANAIYARGGRFLAELRQAMGDADWLAFLHALYTTYHGKVETTGGVLDQAEQAAPGVNLNPLIAEYTRSSGFRAPDEARWTVSAPQTPWSGQVIVTVKGAFPVAAVELWLDDRLVATASGPGQLAVDVSAVPSADYVLLARATDDQGNAHERAMRVHVGDLPAS
jgi:Peptidase family M1 domain